MGLDLSRSEIYKKTIRQALRCDCHVGTWYITSPSIYANKINKKAILSIHTADICRQVVVCSRKTLIFGITQKALKIRVICFFDADKNQKQFQEPPVLESNSYVSCRWNRPFYHKEPPFFDRKSMEWSLFLLYALPEEVILCHADLANRRFWFSISLKIAMMIFIYIRLLLIIFL